MSPLRDRRFVLLLVGQAVNGIGSWCALVAMWGYAAYRFDASATQIALLSVSWALPPALLGPLGGVPVDRLGPRRVLMVGEAAAAVVAVALAFSATFTQLVVLGLLLGCARVFSEPAFGALAPRLVDEDQLLRANALLGSAMQLSVAVGPLAAAAAISLWGARGAFLVDAATYLVGIAVVVPLRLRAIPPPESAGVMAELREGVQVVRSRPALLRLFQIGGALYLIWGAFAVIEPLYVRDILDRPPATFAFLQAVFGVTMVATGLLVPRVGARAERLSTVRLAVLGSGVAAAVYVGSGLLLGAVAGIALWGVATGWFLSPHRTLVQRDAPVETHGRVMALDAAVRNWAHVIAMPTTALLIGAVGIRVSALVFAAVPVLAAVFVGARDEAALPAEVATVDNLGP